MIVGSQTLAMVWAGFADFGSQVAITLTWAALGLVLFGAAFWLMSRLAPFSVKKEIEEDQNTALAIIMGSVIIGIALIIMGAVGG